MKKTKLGIAVSLASTGGGFTSSVLASQGPAALLSQRALMAHSADGGTAHASCFAAGSTTAAA